MAGRTDVEKINEVQIVESNSSALKQFVDIVDETMRDIQIYSEAYEYDYTESNIFIYNKNTPLKQSFEDYKAYALSNPSVRNFVDGETTPYPEFVKR